MEPDVRILIIDNQASVVKDLRALIVCVQPAVWRRLLCATSRPDTYLRMSGRFGERGGRVEGRLATLQLLEGTCGVLYRSMGLLQSLPKAQATHQLHDLALTLAALDRLLTSYVHQLVRSQGHNLTARMSKSLSAHHLDRSLAMLRDTAGGSLDLHPYRGGFGGADSLLLSLCHALSGTAKCLEGAHRPLWRRPLLASVVALAALKTLHRHKGKGGWGWVLLLLWGGKRLGQYLDTRALGRAQSQLHVVLRLWVLVDYVVAYTQSRRHSQLAHKTLIARPTLDDGEEGAQWRCRTLLEAVPPTSAAAFWYEAAPVVALFRLAVDVTYASHGDAFKATQFVSGNKEGKGWGWAVVGVPVLCLSSLYHCLRPHRAALKAATLMTHPSLSLLTRAWTCADNPLTAQAAKTLAWAKGLQDQRTVEVGGMSCHVLGTGGPYTQVLMFVHGGGWLAHLHCVDLPVLTAWAKALGDKALIVVPHYTLLPEGRYPVPNRQVYQVYKHITQGALGFVPDRVLLAGESAGGNLACSLLVRLIVAAHRSELQGCLLYDPHLGPAPLPPTTEDPNDEDDDTQEAFPAPTPAPSPAPAPARPSEEEEDDGSVPLPCALVLFYPALNFALSPSPSRAVHLCDPILPLGVVTAITKAFVPPHVKDPSKDPELCPYFASEGVLRYFPTTFMAGGGFDPLLDDTVDFDVRLERAGVHSTLRLGRDLPHGFFGLYGIERSATEIIDESAEFLAAQAQD